MSGCRHLFMIMLAAPVMLDRLYKDVDVFMYRTYMEKDFCKVNLPRNCNSPA